MDPISSQLALRDRLMRRMYQQMTPQERLARGEALRARGMEQLAKNPEGMERFIRRNIRQRAIDRSPDA